MSAKTAKKAAKKPAKKAVKKAVKKPLRKAVPKAVRKPARKPPVKKAVRKPALKAPAAADLLLEIGTEEIPAGYLPPAIEQLAALAREELAGNRLAHGKVSAWATPRRLVLLVEGVASRQEESEKTVTGPPKAVAFGPDGKPTKAAEGFARTQGVDLSSLTVVSTDRGEYVAAVKREASLPASAILPGVMAGLIGSLHFPKFQRWGSLALKFPRPIRWLLCLHGKEVVRFDLSGIASGRETRGHRFLAPGPFAVKDPAHYFAVMRKAQVVVDQEERKRLIRQGVAAAAKALKGKAIEDEELVGTVANLVEHPAVVTGSFDKRYLALPWEVLITSMRAHQKYFALTDNRGSLLPHFVTVSNNRVRDPKVVAAGNERVLRARLEDAMFFFTEDRKIPLEQRVEQLRAVVFQERLGTSYEKMQRFTALANLLCEKLDPFAKEDALTVASLCKGDLVTLMVGEFAELQGIMGREYARLEGYSDSIAQGIADHYLPRVSGGETPRTAGGALVGIADRLDTLCGCFAIGITPTGTADPYALRRHALAIVAILLDRGWRLSLRESVGWSLDLLAGKVDFEKPAVEAALAEFLRGRLQNLFVSRGHRADLTAAVLEDRWEDPVDALARLTALAAFAASPGFDDLMASFKRVLNIIPPGFAGEVDPALPLLPAESALLAAVEGARGELEALGRKGDHGQALATLAALKAPVDAFFTEVLVMDKDPRVKQNRLAILRAAALACGGFADFRKVSTEK